MLDLDIGANSSDIELFIGPTPFREEYLRERERVTQCCWRIRAQVFLCDKGLRSEWQQSDHSFGISKFHRKVWTPLFLKRLQISRQLCPVCASSCMLVRGAAARCIP